MTCVIGALEVNCAKANVDMSKNHYVFTVRKLPLRWDKYTECIPTLCTGFI